MNIEENIKPLKILMNKYKKIDEMNNFNHELALVIDYTELSAIETLLTAYEKEKETSHYIQSQLDIANAKLVEEKEKNKELTDEYLVQRDLINPDFLKDYIHKDKIKAKIEEYKEKCKNCNFRGKICDEFTKNYECTIGVCLKEFYSLLEKE